MGVILGAGDVVVQAVQPIELRTGNTVMARVVGFRGDRVGLRIGSAVVWGRTNLVLEEDQVVPLKVEAVTSSQVWLRAGLENPGAEEKSLPAALRDMGLEPTEQFLFLASVLLESGQALSREKLLRLAAFLPEGEAPWEMLQAALLLDRLGPLTAEAAAEILRFLAEAPSLTAALRFLLEPPYPKSFFDPTARDPEASLEEALSEERPDGRLWRLLGKALEQVPFRPAVAEALRSVLWNRALAASGPWLAFSLPVRMPGERLVEAKLYLARRAGRLDPRETVIRFHLETLTLGTVGAELRLWHGRASLRLEAENHAIAMLFRRHLPGLREALGAAGLRLERLEVTASGPGTPGNPDLGPPLLLRVDRRV